MQRVWWLPVIDGWITPIVTWHCEVYDIDWHALDWMISRPIRRDLALLEEKNAP